MESEDDHLINEGSKNFLSGCQGFLAKAVDTVHVKKIKPEEILIVQNFLDVFPRELPRLPPDRAISFQIELLPGTT